MIDEVPTVAVVVRADIYSRIKGISHRYLFVSFGESFHGVDNLSSLPPKVGHHQVFVVALKGVIFFTRNKYPMKVILEKFAAFFRIVGIINVTHVFKTSYPNIIARCISSVTSSIHFSAASSPLKPP